MKTCLIACRTIEEELLYIEKTEGVSYETFWLPSGLHNVPRQLQDTLQETVDYAQQKGYDRLLLAMGYCGNAVAGIHADTADIYIPRVDDCISLLLGSVHRREELTAGHGTYFLTKGWLQGEKNISIEYDYALHKYGEKRGKQIFAMMLSHYKRIGVIDMKAYPPEQILPRTEEIARRLGLDHEIFPGDPSFLRRILKGPWDEEHFLHLKPLEKICPEELD